MERIWLKSYPEGVPAEIDLTQYRSLVHLLEDSFSKFASRDAYACLGKRMSYGELDRYSKQIAAWLQSKGLARGARVAVMMPNLLQYPIVMAAILRAGYVVVNVNPLYTPRELEHQLKDSGAEVIFILDKFANTLQQVLSKTQIKQTVVCTVGDMLGLKGSLINFVMRYIKKDVPAYALPGSHGFKQILSEGSQLNFKPVEIQIEDVAFLQYTGGTTGVSKGATLSHKNVVANVLQADVWLRGGKHHDPSAEQKVIVCALPLYHIFALTICSLIGTRIGGLNLLIPNPRDIPGFVKELRSYKVSFFPAVNTLYNGLLNNPDFASLDFSRLEISCGGGMAVQRTVAERWQKVTGCAILEGYGLSETAPLASANIPFLSEFTGTIGMPISSTDIAILDDAGNPVALGQPGEISIRGPQVMQGYWQRPDETAKVMTPDGFFKTGDIGVMDERGYIKIVDRKKDMILVSGFNVYPNEIEEVVMQHPGVAEVACIGVPDANSGEAVKLFVVRKDPGLTSEQLMEFCKQQFTAYKKPKFIEFRDALPKSPVGKILRKDLRPTPPASQ